MANAESTAAGLIHRHHENAVALALRHAGDELAAGDVRKFWEWIEVMSVVSDLLKPRPRAVALLH
jgi:hypothetical protein